MLTAFYTFLAETPPTQQPPDMMSTFVWFGAIMVIMWVLMIRPQQKRQKQLLEKVAALKTGDRVITTSGIHGVVSNLKDGPTLTLKVDDNVKLTMDKSAIATVLTKEAN